MAICSGLPDISRWRDRKPDPDDFFKFAKGVVDRIFLDVFYNNARYSKHGNGGYPAAAEVGVGPKGAGEISHHMVNQCAHGFLGSNADLIEIAKGYGVENITREHIDSIIHHPLNVVNLPKGEHDEISDEYRSWDEKSGSSHLYQFERVQSYQNQMVTALKALHAHSSDHGWQSYLDKVEYFRNRNF